MTEGFYKLDENNNLLYAPNAVYAPSYTLLKADKDTYTYPIDGWRWFATERDAKLFFELL
jgi:hypothetical protein